MNKVATHHHLFRGNLKRKEKNNKERKKQKRKKERKSLFSFFLYLILRINHNRSTDRDLLFFVIAKIQAI